MKKLFVVILIGLSFSALCFATIFYNRTPPGIEITSPVNLEWSWDNYNEVCTSCDGDETYQLKLNHDPPPSWVCGLSYPVATLSGSENFEIPVGTDNWGIYMVFGIREDYDCEGYVQETYDFEVGTSTPCFTIIEGEEEDYIFSFTTSNLNSLINSIKEFFDSVWPLIALIIGIPLAFYVIGKIISIFPM